MSARALKTVNKKWSLLKPLKITKTNEKVSDEVTDGCKMV